MVERVQRDVPLRVTRVELACGERGSFIDTALRLPGRNCRGDYPRARVIVVQVYVAALEGPFQCV